MKRRRARGVLSWMFVGLMLWTAPGWAQATSPIQNGQVEIHGALPRTAAGAVDVEALTQTIQTQFARPGVQEVQFRAFSLTEEEQRTLFLNGDPSKNLLRQVSVAVPSHDGAERTVTFRTNDFRARVGREDGQLRARIEGIDHSQLTEGEGNRLRMQFDRFRLEGGRDRGAERADNRGGLSDNSGPGSINSGPGSINSGPGSMNSGRGGRDEQRVAQAGEMRQNDRRADRQADRRSNAGGELRGLDRADQVAGEHGREGRDNARAVQLDRPNRPERPQRPERPERPQRPERPERSGRN